MTTRRRLRRVVFVVLAAAASLLGGAGRALLGDCGPFTDVSSFCSPILELYYLGLTTSTTTFSPDRPATRGEAAAFVARSFNQSIKRAGLRAALGQWWTPRNPENLARTSVGAQPRSVRSDGADLWVANSGDGTVSRVRGSDGRLLETSTGASEAFGILVAMGRIFVTGQTFPGRLYMIDPSQPAGTVTLVADNLGDASAGIGFDGERIWTANIGSVSIVTPGPTTPWSATTVTNGFTRPEEFAYDGSNMWLTDFAGSKLLKLDSAGGILQSVDVAGPYSATFDGSNLWIPTAASSPDPASVVVVRASTATILATLTQPAFVTPVRAGFDGERILVADIDANLLFLWRASDLQFLGSISTGPGTNPQGLASDGLNSWITLAGTGELARF